MNRSLDWLHQAQVDLAQAQLSADGGHHEWACFACHQAAEKPSRPCTCTLASRCGATAWGAHCGICPPRPLPPLQRLCLISKIGCAGYKGALVPLEQMDPALYANRPRSLRDRQKSG